MLCQLMSEIPYRRVERFTRVSASRGGIEPVSEPSYLRTRAGLPSQQLTVNLNRANSRRPAVNPPVRESGPHHNKPGPVRPRRAHFAPLPAPAPPPLRPRSRPPLPARPRPAADAVQCSVASPACSGKRPDLVVASLSLNPPEEEAGQMTVEGQQCDAMHVKIACAVVWSHPVVPQWVPAKLGAK